MTAGTTITQTAAAFIPDATSPRVPETASPEIRDVEDGLVNVTAGGDGDRRGEGPPSKAGDARAAGAEQEMAEEGSTPNVVAYAPGYDYVVEERMTEEEGIIDLDVTTSASHKGPLQSSTPTPTPGPATPTLQTTTAATARATSEAAATYAPSPPRAATVTWAPTPGRDPFAGPPYHHHRTTTAAAAATHRVRSRGYRTTAGPLAVSSTGTAAAATTVTDRPLRRSTPPPPVTVRKAATPTTAAAPRSTIRIIKIRKPSAGPKRNSSAPATKKPSSWSKGSRPKNPNQQRPRSPGSRGSASNQSDLLAREPVSLDIFWVIGNWSEVGGEMFTTALSSLLKHHTSKFSCFSPLTA